MLIFMVSGRAAAIGAAPGSAGGVAAAVIIANM